MLDAVLSLAWADYRPGSKKAKVHGGFDLNHSIPAKIFLTAGKGEERPFVNQILPPGQTGVMDRYSQCHKNVDLWQEAGKPFACRIKAGTRKTCLKVNHVPEGSPVVSDAVVLLGTRHQNQTQRELRVLGCRVGAVAYWVATDRHDLFAEDIAMIYKRRGQIEIFFGGWQRHLQVYHLIVRSRYGLMVQIMGGLLTDLLLAIYGREQHQEKVSIHRGRELRLKIQNEARNLDNHFPEHHDLNEHHPSPGYAKT